MVTNTGAKAGRHSVLLFASKPDQPDAEMPKKELVAFESVALAPGESTEVNFTVGFEELKYWNEKKGRWEMPVGNIVFSAL
jgi:beta-glucosidase